MARGRTHTAATGPSAWLGARFGSCEQIGEGSFGRVFRAYDQSRQRMVALKLLKLKSAEECAAFREEYRVLRTLESPYMVRALDWFEFRTGCAYSMELIEGVSFVRWVRESGRCNEARLRAGLWQVALALETLAQQRLIHRDIKPDNLLVTPDGHVTLVDFGLATKLSGTSPPQARSDGTLAYMAPEQLASQPMTGASDIYGLGVVSYEALTGRRPFEGDARAQMLAKFGQKPHPPSAWVRGASPELECLVLQMLAVEPAQRPTVETLKSLFGDGDDAKRSGIRGR